MCLFFFFFFQTDTFCCSTQCSCPKSIISYSIMEFHQKLIIQLIIQNLKHPDRQQSSFSNKWAHLWAKQHIEEVLGGGMCCLITISRRSLKDMKDFLKHRSIFKILSFSLSHQENTKGACDVICFFPSVMKRFGKILNCELK